MNWDFLKSKNKAKEGAREEKKPTLFLMPSVWEDRDIVQELKNKYTIIPNPDDEERFTWQGQMTEPLRTLASFTAENKPDLIMIAGCPMQGWRLKADLKEVGAAYDQSIHVDDPDQEGGSMLIDAIKQGCFPVLKDVPIIGIFNGPNQTDQEAEAVKNLGVHVVNGYHDWETLPHKIEEVLNTPAITNPGKEVGGIDLKGKVNLHHQAHSI